MSSQLYAPAAFLPERKYPFTYCEGKWVEFEAVPKGANRWDISLVAGNRCMVYRAFISE
jgi:hypothetical protein